MTKAAEAQTVQATTDATTAATTDATTAATTGAPVERAAPVEAAAPVGAVRVSTKDNELSLEEMSEALPDTATIMTRVGECWWHLIYAARGGNWDLADYYLRRVRKLENTLATLRPKHAERLARFQHTALPAVVAAIEAHDHAALETAYQAATDMANELHAESGYPYIRWELPTEPPHGLTLQPITPPATPPNDGHHHTSH